MNPPKLGNWKNFIALAAAFFLLGGQPIEFGREKSFFHGYSMDKPVIRIGLGVHLSEIKISSSSGMEIYEVKDSYTLIAEDAAEAYIKGKREKINEKFVVQVSRYREREKAEIAAQELRTQITYKIYVRESPGNDAAGKYQVNVGDFITRGDALRFMVRLNSLGDYNPWIIKQEISAEESRPLWILVGERITSLKEDTVLYFIPSNPQSFLSYDGRDYRGIFSLQTSPQGIVLINTLSLEDYLKAVVPSELSPYDFREIEAHKAQAVAARTYAIKNLKQNEDLGFDVDDTPRSQFYKGLNAEHPLSTAAVESTAGEVAQYKGKLIDALYTSTCGGRTENVEDVFLGPALPYLRSTECTYEKQEEWEILNRETIIPVYLNGKNISLEIASLIGLNVLPGQVTPVYFQENLMLTRAVEWINRAAGVLGKHAGLTSEEDRPFTLKDFVDLAGSAFDWNKQAEIILPEGEKEFLTQDYGQWPAESRSGFAMFLNTGIFNPDRNEISPEKILSRGEAAYYLWKVMGFHHDLFEEGRFRSFSEGVLTVENGEENQELVLPKSAFLVRSHDREQTLVSRLHLMGDEKLRWLKQGDRIQLLEVIYPPNSNVLDRMSIFHSWQVRKSSDELSRRINRYYPVGELLDIYPEGRGISHRITSLRIKGKEDEVVVKGLRIRTVLGLRETYFVIDRKYGPCGQVTEFTFSGRGWGHGVGLCQVGAYGMARSGAGYQEILKKYYYGIDIKKIY
jgi:stage II sporulation protein D